MKLLKIIIFLLFFNCSTSAMDLSSLRPTNINLEDEVDKYIEAFNSQASIETQEPDIQTLTVLTASTRKRKRQTCQLRRAPAKRRQTAAKRYPCSFQNCDKSYSQKISLQRHLRTKHLGVRYPCHQCDKSFTQKGDLNLHIKSIHQGVKHTCNRCDKSFSRKIYLQRHLRTKHLGVRYPCDQCSHKPFSTQKGLNLHIKSIHQGVKHTCNRCAKSFSRKGALQRHIRTKHPSITINKSNQNNLVGNPIPQKISDTILGWTIYDLESNDLEQSDFTQIQPKQVESSPRLEPILASLIDWPIDQ